MCTYLDKTDLNGVMEIGDRLIAAQQNAAPDHRAHAPQNHLELVDANRTRFDHRSFILPGHLTAVRFSGVARIFMLSAAPPRQEDPLKFPVRALITRALDSCT
jgi:hypothetical protein